MFQRKIDLYKQIYKNYPTIFLHKDIPILQDNYKLFFQLNKLIFLFLKKHNLLIYTTLHFRFKIIVFYYCLVEIFTILKNSKQELLID
jgi:hypothetical protein